MQPQELSQLKPYMPKPAVCPADVALYTHHMCRHNLALALNDHYWIVSSLTTGAAQAAQEVPETRT